MQSKERLGGGTQVVAWLGVLVVHAGLFWLLTCQGRLTTQSGSAERLRLVFVPRSRQMAPVAPSDPLVLPPLPSRPVRPAIRPRPIDLAAPAGPPLPTPSASTAEATPSSNWAEQARQSAQAREPLSFTADPLRNRHAQLPGGDGRGRFRMKEPLTPRKVLRAIGEMAGGRGYSQSPCPRIAANLPGLLTATSDQERELLEEELRRDREYCRP